MSRGWTRLRPADAVARLRGGMRVLVPPGCGEPVALVDEICRQSERLRDLALVTGIHLRDYPWARPEHAALRCITWHMAPGLGEAHRRGRVEFAPLRYFDLVAEFSRGGRRAADCVLLQVPPPDAGGWLSLGVSAGVVFPAALGAPLVIAQVNPAVPRTRGAALHVSQVDAWIDVEEPLLPYPPTAVGEVERAIGAHVAALVPDGATVQVGVGAIPQAVLEALGGHRDLGLHSLLVDPAVPLVERGVVTCARKPLHRGRLDLAEIMGTRRLFEFVDGHPMVSMDSSAFVHDPALVSRLDRFVSVNSALEVDLTGQVNAETLRGRQVAGIGGQFDFVLGASRAAGGVSVIALPATGRGGTVSRIVARLAEGAAVTTPRYVADVVVTEHGAARLRGRGLRERAAALIAVAHPRFQPELERSLATS